MKKIRIFYLLMALCVWACDDDEAGEELNISEFDGIYEGNFWRTTRDTVQRIVTVNLTLFNGAFEGTTTLDDYPIICAGTFTNIGSDSLSFSNSCAPATDSLNLTILDGGFAVRRTAAGTVLLQKTIAADTVDTFDLLRVR